MADIVVRNPHNLIPQHDGTLIMEGAQITYRNFEGRESQFNRPGDRNFAVVLDDVTAEELLAKKWNVRTKPAKDDPEQNFNTLSVKIGSKGRPPNIFMITRRGRTRLAVGDVDIFDWVEFLNVDLKIRAYKHDLGGTGITAYLQAFYATIYEDDLERKYADVPDAGMPALNPPDDVPDGLIIPGEVDNEES